MRSLGKAPEMHLLNHRGFPVRNMSLAPTMIRVGAQPRRWLTQTLKKFLNSPRFMQFTFKLRCGFDLIFDSIRSQGQCQAAQLLRPHKIQTAVWRPCRHCQRASKDFGSRLRMKCTLCRIRACGVLIESKKGWERERTGESWRWNIRG